MRDFLKKTVGFAKNHPVILGAIATTAVFSAGVWAWGPNRTLFTIEKPASYVTFNSITNNPNIGGDERNFVGIREKGTQNAWSDNVKIQNGKEYYVRMYVHNNAASNLNLVAENVVANMNIPNTTAKSITVDGMISSSNANPNKVWDNATFTSDENFNLTYVAGSALFENNSVGKGGGVQLPDSLVTATGAKLGYDKLDGKIPGCFQYAGYVTVLVRANTQQPTSDFSISKTVRKIGGEKAWSENVHTNSGDTVEFQVHVKNVGQAPIENLVVRDILPNGLTYIAGSAKLYNTTNPQGLQISDNLVKDNAVNIGKYNAGGDAYVRLRAKVAENDKLPVCGKNTLTNLAQASNQKITKNDTASVTVDKKCTTPTPVPQPEFKCSAITINKVKSEQKTTGSVVYNTSVYEFNTTYVVKNTEFVGVKYVIKDASGKIVSEKIVNGGSKFTFTSTSHKSEKYTVIATVITKNGENTNANCEKTFETEAPVQPTPTPVVKCESIVITQISRTKFEIITNITKQNITNIFVKYEIKDSNGKVVQVVENNGSKTTIEINISGTYTIVAIVSGNGANSSTCQKQITVNPEPKVETPEISISKTVNGGKMLATESGKDFNYEITVRNTGNKDLKDVKVTDRAPANVKFISSDKGEIKNETLTFIVPTLKIGESQTIVIKAQATATNIKAKNIACVDTPTIPGENDGCDSADIEVPKVNNPTNPTPNNPVPPTTSTVEMPKELPKTGIDGFGALVAISSLTTAFAYYFASRKTL